MVNIYQYWSLFSFPRKQWHCHSFIALNKNTFSFNGDSEKLSRKTTYLLALCLLPPASTFCRWPPAKTVVLLSLLHICSRCGWRTGVIAGVTLRHGICHSDLRVFALARTRSFTWPLHDGVASGRSRKRSAASPTMELHLSRVKEAISHTLLTR